MRLDNRESARTALGTQGGPARPKTSFSGEALATELVESMLAMLWGAQLVRACTRKGENLVGGGCLAALADPFVEPGGFGYLLASSARRQQIRVGVYLA